MAGVILKPIEALAGEYLGQRSDVRDAGANEPTLKSLQYSEASHLTYQGPDRGSMRFNEFHNLGQSQARPGNLFVIHNEKDLKRRLDRVMPGANWPVRTAEWEVKGTYDTSLRLGAYLRLQQQTGTFRVSICRAKSDLDLGNLPSKSWLRARDAGSRIHPGKSGAVGSSTFSPEWSTLCRQ